MTKFLFSKKLLAFLSLNYLLFFSDIIHAKGPIALIIGTRPEAIKMIPAYKALKKENIPVFLCSSGQHADLLKNICNLFEVQPDVDLSVMQPAQNLSSLTQILLKKFEKLFRDISPSLVLVQGDTTTAMAASLAAFYCKIPIAHLEAGLRTNDLSTPFPEEMNRRFISLVATYHFTPTEQATKQLNKEGIDPKNIFYIGNTVSDALFSIQKKIASREILPNHKIKQLITNNIKRRKKTLLLTVHRRETITHNLAVIFSAIKTILTSHPDIQIVFPMHPNPKIQAVFEKSKLNFLSNITTLTPLPYQDMVYLLTNADGVITDSGGVQEEATMLRKPTFVLRDKTDRPEGLQSSAILVGTEQKNIEKKICQWIKENCPNPKKKTDYGDGNSAQRLAKILKKICTHKNKSLL